MSPSVAPIPNAHRHPSQTGTWRGSSSTSVAAAATAAPIQYEPLMIRSTRPRTRAGISSSIAELIAAYSPSRIHVAPSETTISQCHRLHGSPSNRAGTYDSMVSPFAIVAVLSRKKTREAKFAFKFRCSHGAARHAVALAKAGAQFVRRSARNSDAPQGRGYRICQTASSSSIESPLCSMPSTMTAP